MDNQEYKLNEETARGYEIEPGTPPIFRHLVLGQVDIRTLTPQKADQLIAAGVTQIRKKETPPPAAEV